MAWLSLKVAVLCTAVVDLIAGAVVLAPLFFPQYLPLWPAWLTLPHERAAVLGGLLIYLAILTTLNALFPIARIASNILRLCYIWLLGSAPAVVVGFVVVVLTANAIVRHEFVLALLILPVLAVMMSAFCLDQKSELAEDDDKEEESFESPALTPQSGRSPSFVEMDKAFWKISLIVFMLGAFVAFIPLGFALYRFLQGVLLMGSTPQLSLIAATRLVASFCESLSWFVLLFVTLALVAASVEIMAEGIGRDARRDLSSEELGLIAKAQKAITAFAESHGYGRRNYGYWVVTIGFYGLVIAIAIGNLLLAHQLPIFPQPPSGEWYYRSAPDDDLFVALAIGLPIFALFVQVPSYLLAVLWPWYGNRFAWRALSNTHTMNDRLLSLIRHRRLAEWHLVDLGRLMRRANWVIAKYWVMLFLLAIFAMLWAEMLSRHTDVATSSGVTIADRFLPTSRHYDFRDVRVVRIYCWNTSKKSDHGYVVEFSDGKAVNLARGTSRDLGGLIMVDYKLVDLKVPVLFGVGPDNPFQKDCIKRFASRYSDPAKVEALFHLDEAR